MKPKHAQLEMVRLEDIREAERNPKAHDIGQLMASIRRFGFQDFPTRNETTGRLVEGHGRVEALRALKDAGEEPPGNVVARGKSWFCPVVTGLSWTTDDEAMAYLLAHNQLTISSGWERDLAHVLADLKSRDVPVIGWRDDQIAKMMAEVRAHQRALARDTAPPPPAEPIAKLGDVWQLGDHLLYCGSCEDLPKVMGDRRAQLMVTDPPYGVDYGAKTNFLNRMDGGSRIEAPIVNDALPPKEMGAFWLRCFTAARAVLDRGASFYISGPTDTLLMWHLQGALIEAGLYCRQQIMWLKNHLVLGNADYHGKHEPLFYGWTDGGHFRVADRTQTTVWEIDKPHESKLHPCLAPEAPVLTSVGYRPIADVVVGDRVLTHDGRYKAVVAAFASPGPDHIFNISVRGAHADVRATWNHPFLVCKAGPRGGAKGLVSWVHAQDLKPGDYLMTPAFSDAGEETPDPEWAWAAGLWLAEGSVLPAGHGDNRYPVFTLHNDETAFVDRLRRLFPDIRTYANGKNAQSLMVFTPGIVDEFIALMGTGARTKRVGERVLKWPTECRQAFLDGYIDGDGWRLPKQMRCKTASADLAATIRLLGESLGYKTSGTYDPTVRTNHIAGRAVTGTGGWTVYFYDGDARRKEKPSGHWVKSNGRWYSVRKITSVKREPYGEQVWNLTVEDDHTFQTAVGMSHNTMKPVELYRRAIRNSSDAGDTVLEPFSGSGTCIVACEELGRRCVAAELAPAYVDVAVKRWEEMVAVPASMGPSPKAVLLPR